MQKTTDCVVRTARKDNNPIREVRNQTNPILPSQNNEPGNEVESCLLDYLRNVADFLEQIGKSGNTAVQYRYFLKHGQFFNPAQRPRGFRRKKLKECWKNSQILTVNHPELTYVEGFADYGSGVPFEHAWCVTEAGQVVDVTWVEPGAVYFGIPFNRDSFLEHLHWIMDEGEFRMIMDLDFFDPEIVRLPGGVFTRREPEPHGAAL